ncbi:MAG: prepilin-type N-terminal cleavage/methylation domain-containing protein [Pirellulales bacterium]|nr:prepilin-type N-terminal cleavage/methylation domain-containing protein [Pirellulales bacterium]
MTASLGHGARSAKRGFTLMEMLLVLGLLVVLAAVSWPALRGPIANSRLRDAAAQLRNNLARARLAALNAGRDHVVCFAPGGQRYAIAPHDGVGAAAAFATGEETALQYDDAPERGQRDEAATPASTLVELELPEGVHFAARDLAQSYGRESAAGTSPAAWTDGTTGEASEGESAGAERSLEAEQIVFHPDGSCSDATIRLNNERRFAITVQLRGLTAVATVGPLERDEVEP